MNNDILSSETLTPEEASKRLNEYGYKISQLLADHIPPTRLSCYALIRAGISTLIRVGHEDPVVVLNYVAHCVTDALNPDNEPHKYSGKATPGILVPDDQKVPRTPRRSLR